MQITEIQVHAGRTVNHPLEQYSNLKPSISLKAVLTVGDDPEQSVKGLQALAERLVEEHKHQMIADIKALDYRMRQQADLKSAERELVRLEERIKAAKIELGSESPIEALVDEETTRRDRRY